MLEGGRDLTINMRWGERGGQGEINDNDNDCRRGGAVQAKIGGKGWQGDDEGDDCGRVSHVFVAQECSASRNEVSEWGVGLQHQQR